jgi:hypothetical protein
MTLPNGHYRTKAGSTVEVYGDYSGCVRVLFARFDEPRSCFDCTAEPYPEDWGDGTYRLTWHCEHCGGGSAVLEPDLTAGEVIAVGIGQGGRGV